VPARLNEGDLDLGGMSLRRGAMGLYELIHVGFLSWPGHEPGQAEAAMAWGVPRHRYNRSLSSGL
jgi:hypothetical protein